MLPTTTHRNPLARFAAIAAVCIAAAVLVSACGEASGQNGSAGASSHTSNQENSRLKFTQCMREHGVKIPEGAAGGAPGGATGGGPPSGLANTPRSTIQAAISACKQYSTGSFAKGPSIGNQAQVSESLLKFARCLRENGVSVSEPTGTSSTALQGFFQQLQSVRGTPAFKTASAACSKDLPNGGQAARPGEG